MNFKENVSKVDQLIRYFLVFVFVVLSFIFSPWFIIGAILMLVTGYFKFCVIYKIFGFATCKMDAPKQEEK